MSIPASMTNGQQVTREEKAFLELHETVPVAVQALLEHERVPYSLWEASCGKCAMVRELRKAGHQVFASDISNWKSPDQDAYDFDFLAQTDIPMPGIDAIIQNPPFSRAAKFIKKSIELCPLVYMLLPLRFLEAGNEKTEEGRERLFCLDAGYLARVLIFRNRLPMMHRDGWVENGGEIATSTMAFAWFIFSWYHKGPTLLERISWRPDQCPVCDVGPTI